MNISNLSLVYFSPTDSTKHVLEQMADVWGQSCKAVDITDYGTEEKEQSFSEDELVFIGVPSYGGRVPKTAVSRLKSLRGRKTPAVLVVTYGNRAYEDTLAELQDIAVEQGFLIAGAAAVVTEHSILHQYGAGRPDIGDQGEIAAFARAVKEKLLKADCPEKISALPVPGNRPYKEYGVVPLVPSLKGTCSQCGLCAKKCPVHAISAANPKEVDKDACISCLRCMKVCPSRARKGNGLLLFLAGQKLKKACSEAKQNEFYV